jgi:hypothetical protein
MFADISSKHKLIHILPLLPVYFVVITVIFAFTNCYAFSKEDKGNLNIWKIFLVPIFYFLAGMVIVCHQYAMWTNPGDIVKIQHSHTDKSVLENGQILNDKLFCKKCNNSRPERAHHCKVCNKCILKMDHHCPWIANCVGVNNIKYFYQFLFYATFGDMLAFFCLFSTILNRGFEMNDSNTITGVLYENKDLLLLVFGSMMALAMTLAIGLLWSVQTQNIIYNTTTIESRQYPDPRTHPWISGSNLWKNFKLVMGNNIWDWFFPIETKHENYTLKFNDKRSYQAPDNKYLSLEERIEDDLGINLQD